MKANNGRERERCTKCIYGVLKYSKDYGGFIVGCNSDHPDRLSEFGNSCFVPKDQTKQ